MFIMVAFMSDLLGGLFAAPCHASRVEYVPVVEASPLHTESERAWSHSISSIPLPSFFFKHTQNKLYHM